MEPGSVVEAGSINSMSSSEEQLRPKSTRGCRKACCICVLFSTVLLQVILFFIFIVVPLVFHFSTAFQREITFLHHSKREVPSAEQVGLSCLRAFFLSSTECKHIGAWYIPPADDPRCSPWNRSQLSVDNNAVDWFTADDRLVVLFTHGARGSRGTSLRIARYKVWSRSLHFHVIAFDYRGFADSCQVPPSVPDMTNDTATVYKWLLANGVPPKRILLWGHSLGTAVAIRFLSGLPSSKDSPVSTVLESPLTSSSEAIMTSKLTLIYQYMPFFGDIFVKPIASNAEFNVDSIVLLPKLKCPLLILNAQDDKVLSAEMGRKMYYAVLRDQPKEWSSRARFVSFPAEKKYGHSRLSTDPSIPQIITDFIHPNSTQ